MLNRPKGSIMYTSRPHNPVPKFGEAVSLIRIFLPCGHCSRVTNDQRHGNDNASDEKNTRSNQNLQCCKTIV